MLGESQILNIPFSGGVNERDREELLQPGTMRALTCWRMTKTGGYEKAPGNAPLSMSIQGGGTISSARRMMAFRGETLLMTETGLYSRITHNGNWRSVGLAPACSAKRTGVASFVSTSTILAAAGLSVFAPCIAAVSGYLVVAWMGDTGAISYAVVSDTTYARVISGTIAAASQTVLAMGSIGTQVFLFYTTSGSANIKTVQIDTSTLTVGAAANTITNGYAGASPTQGLDVVTLSDRIAVAYNNNTGGVNSISVKTYNAPANVLTLIATNNAVPNVNPPIGAVGICGDMATNHIFVGSNRSAFVTSVTGINATTLAVDGVQDTVVTNGLEIMGMVTTGAAAGFIWGTKGVQMWCGTWTQVAGFIIVGPQPMGTANVGVYSKPFLVGSRYYGMCHPLMTGLPPLNQTRVCVDLTEFVTPISGARLYPMATIAPQTSEFSLVPAAQCVAALSATKFATVGASRRTPGSGAIEVDILDFDNPDVGQSAVYGDTLGISGGTPYYYDGATTAEMGFVCSPAVPTGTLAAGALPAGVYRWCVVWEHVDAAGQYHRSAPSPPLSLAMGGANSLILTASKVPFSSRQGIIMARLYRTVLGGSIFYEVPVAPVNVTPNSGSAPTVSFALDNTTDANLVFGAQMYTHPGLLGAAQPRTGPSSLSSLISHQDRLMGVGDDGRTIWVSGQNIQGDGLWWSSFSGFQYPQQTGPVTALASMDGRVVSWTRESPYVLDGQGPPDNGQGGGYVTSQVVSEVGCVSQRSVCVTTSGAVFQSLRGLERLNRSMQVESYFGSRIEDTFATYPVVTSAINQQTSGRILFSCLTAEGSSSGTWLEYDYVNDVWAPCPRMSGVGAQSAAIVDAPTGGDPVYSWVRRSGVVYFEDTSSSLENGTYKPGRLLSPWIHVQGALGWQHVDTVQILAKNLSAHDLRIRVAYDYSSTFTDSVTWTDAQISALSTAREALQVDLSQPECTAFQVEIVDATPSVSAVGTGFGPALIGLQLTARGDDALSKLPGENRQ